MSSLERDPLLLAYLAGVIDSDGFITIRREPHGYHGANPSYTHNECIGCGQTSPEAVTMLADLFGGKITLRARGPATWRPMHYWAVFNIRAALAVEAMRPYLRIKTQQADLVLSIRESKSLPDSYQRRPIGVRGREMRPEVRAARDAAWQACRALNDTRRRSQDEVA